MIKLVSLLLILNASILLKILGLVPLGYMNIMDSTVYDNTTVTSNFESKINVCKNITYIPSFETNNNYKKEQLEAFPTINKISLINFLKTNSIRYNCSYYQFDINSHIIYYPQRSIDDYIYFGVFPFSSERDYNKLFEIVYQFPPILPNQRRYNNEIYENYREIFPLGTIIKISFPTDEIELIYSNVRPKSSIIETYNDIYNLVNKNYTEYNQKIKNKEEVNFVNDQLSFKTTYGWDIFLPLVKFELSKITENDNKYYIKYFNCDFNIWEHNDIIAFKKSISNGSHKFLKISPPFVVIIKKKNSSVPFYFSYVYNDQNVKKYNCFNFRYIDSLGNPNVGSK